VAAEIESLEEERLGLQQEQAASPPSLHTYYQREIIKTNVALAHKRQELRACQLQQNPPRLRPDLVARAVVLQVNHAARTIRLAALIRNKGNGNARGPFKIEFAVTMKRGGVTTTIVHVFQVPAGVTIAGVPVNTPSGVAALVGGQVAFDSEYITEQMQVPLYYRDEDPSCVYEFEFLVDTEAVVAETNEANNSFYVRWWRTTPSAANRAAPFVAESLEAVA